VSALIFGVITLVEGSLSELQQAIRHQALQKHFLGATQGL
jgi:hypothetical protein